MHFLSRPIHNSSGGTCCRSLWELHPHTEINLFTDGHWHGVLRLESWRKNARCIYRKTSPPPSLLSRDKFTYLMTNSTPHSWLLEATQSMALPVPRPCWRVAIPSQLIKCSIIKGGSQWGARRHIRRLFNYTVVSKLVPRER